MVEKPGAAPWPFFYFPLYDPHDDVEQDVGAASQSVSSNALWKNEDIPILFVVVI